VSKIVVFNGSPRKKGYTSKLLEQAVNGAKSKGAEVIEFDLNNPGIRGCQGCFYCRTHDDGCAVKDYLQPMYKAIIEADAIFFGSPIYYHHISGQSRIWLDRTFPFVDENLEPRYPSKKVLVILSQGNSSEDMGAEAIRFINEFITVYGWKTEDIIQYCGTVDPDMDKFEELSIKAYKAGVKLAY
jgi:multimeric flavodoxin WrbA